MNAATPAPPSYKEQMLRSRHEAIVSTASRLLAEKGFDAMTVDEVAAAVGIAKASLFQHFPSKEEMATAAMLRVVERAAAYLRQLPDGDPPLARLKAAASWAMELQLAGDMPLVPSLNSTLRSTLMQSSAYSAALQQVSDILLGWIGAAQSGGQLNPALPPRIVLYTLYARASDPVVEYLKAQGESSGPEIIELVLKTCFDGLAAR